MEAAAERAGHASASPEGAGRLGRDVLDTLGVSDARFAGFAVEVTPYHAGERDRDLTVIRVTAPAVRR